MKRSLALIAALLTGGTAVFADVSAKKLILHMDFNTIQRTRPAVVGLLRAAAAMGYNAVLWEVEDKVKWSLPGIAAPDAFTKEEFREILKEADKLGLEPIPLLQIFGHGEYVLTKSPYVALRENPSEPDGYCVSNPKTFEFQKKLLAEYLDLFGPKVKWFHLGADEAYGFGKCPFCSKRDKMDLYLEHLERISSLLAPRGIRCGVWHDQVCGHPERMPRKYVIWLWDYSVGFLPEKDTPSARIPELRKLGFDLVFAGATSSYNDGPFLPWMRLHRLNLAKGAELARTKGFVGFAVTSWSIRQNLRATQLPLFRFGAKRFLDPGASVSADWAAALGPEKLALTADELDAATAWGHELTGFDGRAFELYKNGTVPTERDFREKVLKKRKLPSEETLKPIREGLARGAAKCTGVWQEAFGLQALTLQAAEKGVRGEKTDPLPLERAIRHLGREQSPRSARHSAQIVWGFYPVAVEDPNRPGQFGDEQQGDKK